jgi:hypothetical protein
MDSCVTRLYCVVGSRSRKCEAGFCASLSLVRACGRLFSRFFSTFLLHNIRPRRLDIMFEIRLDLTANRKLQLILLFHLLGYYDDFNITLEPLRLTPSGD